MWRKRHLLELGPHAAQVRTALGHGRTFATVPTSLFTAGPEMPSMDSVVARLDDYLGSHGDGRSTLDVILGDELVRFATMPWSDSLAGRDDVHAYARIRIEERFGIDPEAWSVQADMRRYGQAGLACALP